VSEIQEESILARCSDTSKTWWVHHRRVLNGIYRQNTNEIAILSRVIIGEVKYNSLSLYFVSYMWIVFELYSHIMQLPKSVQKNHKMCAKKINSEKCSQRHKTDSHLSRRCQLVFKISRFWYLGCFSGVILQYFFTIFNKKNHSK